MVRLSRRHFLQAAGAAAAVPAVDLAQVCGQIANVFIDRHVLNVRPTQTA